MAAQDGPLVALTDAKLEFSDDSFAAHTYTLDLAVGYGFESSLDMVETTNFDSLGMKTYKPANIDGTIGGTLLYDPSDADGYDNLWDLFEASTLINWRYYPTTSTDDPYFYGDGYVTKIGQPVRQGERIEVNFEIQVTGGIAIDTQL